MLRDGRGRTLMAGYQRIDRISETLKHGLVEVIRGLKDPRIASMTSVVSLSVTKDLRYAKVYVSVLGSEEEEQKTLEGLRRAAGFIRKELSRKVDVRYTPELIFEADHSIAHGAKIAQIINTFSEEKHEREESEE